MIAPLCGKKIGRGGWQTSTRPYTGKRSCPMKKELPSPELLRKLLRYEPETGELFWRERPREMCKTEQSWKTWNKRFPDTKAVNFLDSDGYLRGSIFGKTYKAHRICWAIHYGAWPSKHIDHINGIRSDNRVSNMRDVTNIQNQQNRKTTSKNCGVVGVCWVKADRQWRAHIKVQNKLIYLGQYFEIQDAIAARRLAEIRYGYN